MFSTIQISEIYSLVICLSSNHNYSFYIILQLNCRIGIILYRKYNHSVQIFNRRNNKYTIINPFLFTYIIIIIIIIMIIIMITIIIMIMIIIIIIMTIIIVVMIIIIILLNLCTFTTLQVVLCCFTYKSFSFRSLFIIPFYCFSL